MGPMSINRCHITHFRQILDEALTEEPKVLTTKTCEMQIARFKTVRPKSHNRDRSRTKSRIKPKQN